MAPHQQKEYGHAMHSKNKGCFDNSLNPGVTALPISELPFEVLLHKESNFGCELTERESLLDKQLLRVRLRNWPRLAVLPAMQE